MSVTVTATTSTVDLVAELASQGETDLATVHAIRLVAAWERDAAVRPAFRKGLAQVLNDLAVLRFQAEDRLAASGALRAAIAVDPDHPHAVDNLFSVEAAIRQHGTARGSIADTNPDHTKLNPWVVDALDGAARVVGFDGKDVLEIGGTLPRDAAMATGARSWTATDLRAEEGGDDRYRVREADACALPFPDDTFDAAFSSCAFEHIAPLGDALAELRRVLRPGGTVFSKFAPIWTSSMGHHLWVLDDEGVRLSISDPVIPPWGHLLLAEHELEAFLRLSLGPAAADRAVAMIYRDPVINRLTEGDHRRLYEASGLELDLVEPWVNWSPPTDAVRQELQWLHPDAGDPGTFGFTLALSAPDVVASPDSRMFPTPAPAPAPSPTAEAAPIDPALVEMIDGAVLAPFLGDGEVVLELGPRDGSFTARLLARHEQVVVADSALALERLAHRFDGAPGLVLAPLEGPGLSALPVDSITRAVSIGFVATVSHSVLVRHLFELRLALVPGGRAVIEHPDTLSAEGWERFLRGVDAEATGGTATALLTPELFGTLCERVGLQVEGHLADLVPGSCITLLTRPAVA